MCCQVWLVSFVAMAALKVGSASIKVLIPTQQHVRTLNAARLAADVEDVPSIIIARTDAEAATLITSDVDEQDAENLYDTWA